MKGIILAGGSGTRLFPLTSVTSKQLLPVYDKPMIYYPLSTLMLAGIKEILIISTPVDIPNFKKMFGDGSQFGISISYEIQKSPDGLAQAFIIGKDFIDNDDCAMILGDNIFFGGGLIEKLNIAVSNAAEGYATVFGYYVNDPQRFGIMEIDDREQIISIEEKPAKPKSNYCVTGLYFYPKGVEKNACMVTPSARGELEITSLNEIYLSQKKLKGIILGRGFAWMDAGTIDSLYEASSFVQTIEQNQRIQISAPEEIAYKNKWISKKKLISIAEKYGNTNYGQHLMNVAAGKIVY